MATKKTFTTVQNYALGQPNGTFYYTSGAGVSPEIRVGSHQLVRIVFAGTVGSTFVRFGPPGTNAAINSGFVDGSTSTQTTPSDVVLADGAEVFEMGENTSLCIGTLAACAVGISIVPRS